MRKIHFFSFILLALGVLGCEKDCCECDGANNNPLINACSAEDPINETAWLVDLKNSITNCSCQMSIIKGTYRGYQTVFYSIMNDPLCNGYQVISLYNCYGEVIRVFEDINEFSEQVQPGTALYVCKD